MEQIADRVQALATKLNTNSPTGESEESSYRCHRCHDQGFVLVLTDTAKEIPIGDSRLWDDKYNVKPHVTRECRCTETRRIENLFKSSHITDGFQRVGFKGFQVDGRPQCVKDARDAALDYYNRFDEVRKTRANSIALLGEPGSGKTHLLMAVSNGLMRRGVAVQYFPWVEGFGELRDKRDDIEERLTAMKQIDVLYIDDLYKGRRAPTDFQLEQLFNIVNYRYLNCLPMLVSSEKSPDELLAIDTGIARRIWERAEGFRVVMDVTDEEREKGMQLNFNLAKGDVQ